MNPKGQKSLLHITWVLLLLLVPHCSVLAQSPTLAHAIPAAALLGQTTEVRFFGENLSEPKSFWTSFSATVVFVTNASANQTTVRLTLPSDAPVGVGAMRMVTAKGLSSLCLFMVDDLPSAIDSGTNHSLATAQRITLPVAVDGLCAELKTTFYQFTAKKGQRVSVDVVARRLGSALDSVVRVRDATGRELAYSDDDPALGRDSRCVCVLPANGDYFIELRDIEYRGGAKHRFHLRVGDFPLADFPFPFAAAPGTEAQLVFGGRAVESVAAMTVKVPTNAPGNHLSLAAKFPSGQGSTPVSLLLGTSNEVIESEPNDTPQSAQKITLPAAINGRFATPNDRDYFQFDVTKNEMWRFAGRTRTLGSPCDLYVELLRQDGQRIAVTKLSTNEDVAFTQTFADAGTYRLRVEEINRLGGPEMAYRIAITRPEPGFTLSANMEKIEAVSGGVAELKVTCNRSNFDGEIELSCEGLPPGFSLTSHVIAAKANETKLRVLFSEDFAAGQLVNVRLVGTAKVGEALQRVSVSTLPALKRLFPDTPNPPVELDGAIALGVSATPPKPLEEPPPKKKKK